MAAGIPVDITGDLATLREQAMLKAQREGLQKVLSTIASPEDLKSVTLPGDDEITSWVQDFEIEEEKTSASRYIGRFTFRFMAEPIRQFLTTYGVAYAETRIEGGAGACPSTPPRPATPSSGVRPIPGSPPGPRGSSSRAWCRSRRRSAISPTPTRSAPRRRWRATRRGSSRWPTATRSAT